MIDAIESKPGREKELEQTLREVIGQEREAALANGATFFELYRGEGDPRRFSIVQHWKDRETFERFHKQFAPLALHDFVARANELLARPVSEIASFWNPMFD